MGIVDISLKSERINLTKEGKGSFTPPPLFMIYTPKTDIKIVYGVIEKILKR